MKIKILDQAEADLIEGFHFYETQQTGVGDYFLANLYADIESLRLYGGIHLKPYKNYHRLLPKLRPSQSLSARNEFPRWHVRENFGNAGRIFTTGLKAVKIPLTSFRHGNPQC